MRDDLPVGHRVFRLAVLAVLVAAAVATGAGDPAAHATSAVIKLGAQFTRAVWKPLLTGGGWAKPLLPDTRPAPSGSPSPSPKPSAVPLPARTAKPKPTRTKKR